MLCFQEDDNRVQNVAILVVGIVVPLVAVLGFLAFKMLGQMKTGRDQESQE